MPKAAEKGRTEEVRAAGSLTLAALYAENRAAAARLRSCHALHELCEELQMLRDLEEGWSPEPDDRPANQRPTHAVVDPFDIACAELVATYGVHHNSASAMLKRATTLVTQFPAAVEAMEEGWLDEDMAGMLAKQMRTVDIRHLNDVHRAVIAWLKGAIDSGRRPGRHAILDETDRIIAEHDPEGVLFRRSEAVRQRNVRVRRGRDGMSTLHAYLTNAEARAIELRIHTDAAAQKKLDKDARLAAIRDPDRSPDGPPPNRETVRTNDQYRADAFVDALLGPITRSGPAAADDSSENRDSAGATGATGAGDTRAGACGCETRVQIRPNITVLAPLGLNGEPEVYLPRGGPETIDALIALLARSVGATIMVPDTAHGTADPPQGSNKYRLTAEMLRRIRLRDGTCRHPGCSIPAEDCDVDHVRPFSHSDPDGGGLTIESNLMCLCRRHHRFKTFHDWKYQLARDGTLTVRTDTGHTITTDPAGPLARWRQRTASMSGQPEGTPYASTGLYIPTDRPWLDPRPRATAWFRRARKLADERQANSEPPPPPPRDDVDPDPDPPPF